MNETEVGMIIDCNDSHLKNIQSPMNAMTDGIVIDINDLHSNSAF